MEYDHKDFERRIALTSKRSFAVPSGIVRMNAASAGFLLSPYLSFCSMILAAAGPISSVLWPTHAHAVSSRASSADVIVCYNKLATYFWGRARAGSRNWELNIGNKDVCCLQPRYPVMVPRRSVSRWHVLSSASIGLRPSHTSWPGLRML